LPTGIVLTTLGALLLGGLAVEWVGRSLPIPRVTLLLAFGVAIGPQALDLLPSAAAEHWFEPVTTLALVMVGFLVGERFSGERLRERGRVVLTLSVTNVLGAALLTGAGLWLLGAELPLALLLAGIAGASAPAATYDVVTESRSDGPFTGTLLGIVGIDDAWGLLVFSLAVAAAGILLGEAAAATAVQHAAAEVGGAIVLGAVLGLAAGLLTHRIAEGEPTLLEAAGIVLLTAGLATLLEVSFILAAMVLGLVMVNTGRRGNRAFHEIEHLEWPFMVLFFVLAGASLELGALAGIGLLGAGYVALRALGLLLGAVVGGRLCRAEPVVTRWMGLALMPQAGVALGMALVVEQRFPQIGEQLLPLVIGATVVFELVGPVFTRLALRRAGETGAAGASRG
jgi:Kef-type K+ transport system membrane component KefB